MEMEHDWLAVGWKALVMRGVIGIVLGVMAMVWPIATAIALALLFGVWALADGVSSIWQAFQPDARGRVWLGLMGALHSSPRSTPSSGRPRAPWR